jgi:hypothetical protein
MTGMEPELDNELRRLFDHNAARELPPDAFLSDTRRRIAAKRSGRRIARTLAEALVIALIALASPWLIEASTVLSDWLGMFFARLSDFLGSPMGIGLTGLGLAVAHVYRRRRYWR